jgi:hypothetical protein
MGVALLLFNLSRPRRLIELSNLTQTASRTLAENTPLKSHPLAKYHLDNISSRSDNIIVAWEVEVSNEFAEWYGSLNEPESESVDTAVDMLVEYGPKLARPYIDTLKGSRYPNMKELRVQHQGRPYRILFAFDPRRSAYLILGGDKTGDNNWYVDAIRRAEAIYAQHLTEIGE